MVMILILLSETQIICPCSKPINMRQLKLFKLLSKGFEKSVYWNKYKAKSEYKNTTNEYRYSLESNTVGAIDYLF